MTDPPERVAHRDLGRRAHAHRTRRDPRTGDLVDRVVDRLTQSFAEALRLALRRYRSFFNRLLST